MPCVAIRCKWKRLSFCEFDVLFTLFGLFPNDMQVFSHPFHRPRERQQQLDELSSQLSKSQEEVETLKMKIKSVHKLVSKSVSSADFAQASQMISLAKETNFNTFSFLFFRAVTLVKATLKNSKMHKSHWLKRTYTSKNLKNCVQNLAIT